MDGAELIALQKNRFWLTPDGLSLDVGPFVAALEYAAGTQAYVVGKPARGFFGTTLAGIPVAPARGDGRRRRRDATSAVPRAPARRRSSCAPASTATTSCAPPGWSRRDDRLDRRRAGPAVAGRSGADAGAQAAGLSGRAGRPSASNASTPGPARRAGLGLPARAHRAHPALHCCCIGCAHTGASTSPVVDQC